jgi:hypothetical protein
MDREMKRDLKDFTARVVRLQNAFLDIKAHDILLMTKMQRYKFRKALKAVYSFAKAMENDELH